MKKCKLCGGAMGKIQDTETGEFYWMCWRCHEVEDFVEGLQ